MLSPRERRKDKNFVDDSSSFLTLPHSVRDGTGQYSQSVSRPVTFTATSGPRRDHDPVAATRAVVNLGALSLGMVTQPANFRLPGYPIQRARAQI